MEDKVLKEVLMEGARRGGICAEGYGMMRGYDREGLIGYYLDNLDWCMERGFPGIELLRGEFSDIEDRGVYVGRRFDGELFEGLQTYVFHDCSGRIRVGMNYEMAVIPMLYFANGSRMCVECEQRNEPAIHVPLYVGDGCEVEAVGSDGCVFRVFRVNVES